MTSRDQIAARRVEGVERIAVVRANGLGDLMFVLPALDALRATYPAAEIVLLGGPLPEELLATRPSAVDRVLRPPVWRGVWSPAGQEPDDGATDAFFARMQAEGFDLALQLHGGGANSNPFTARLGARLTAGLRAPDAAPLDRWARYVYYQPEVLRYLEAVALVGAPPVSVEPSITVTPDDRAAADRIVAPEGPSVVLNPGATDPRRRWSARSFAAVGDALARRGLRVLVGGATEDQPLARAVVDAMACEATSLAGAMSLSALTGVLAAAALVVSNDSGPLHLAAAAGTATVGIYWCGNAINGGPPAVHLHRKTISWRLNCPDCGVDCTVFRCAHEASFVDDVPVAAVVDEALDLLALEAA